MKGVSNTCYLLKNYESFWFWLDVIGKFYNKDSTQKNKI